MQGASCDEGLHLRILVKRTEADIESVFLSKGGSLGAAAARAETDFALTHSETAVSELVTDNLKQVLIPIPSQMYRRDAASKSCAVIISDRARLNITASRLGASINGTLVGTTSGQGSVTIKELFTEAIKRTATFSDATTDAVTAAATIEGDGADGENEENEVKKIVMETQMIQMPFEQIPLKYSNWARHTSILAVMKPAIVAYDPATQTHSLAQDIQFVTDPNLDLQLKKSEAAMQGLYNAAWKTVKEVPFQPSPNLTKSVMRVPVGFNGSGYAPAAAVNDMPTSFPAQTLENILRACVSIEFPNEQNHTAMLSAFATPSVAAAINFSQQLGSALSAFSAFTMPYRVDGTPMVLPGGVEMVQSESWRAEAIRSARHADDCDGSAAGNIAVIRYAAKMQREQPDRYPNLRAFAHCFDAHFVCGVSVLAANAGHADAANEHAVAVAGHAIALAVPKASFAMALESGTKSKIGDALAVPFEMREAVTKARFDALYPADLIAAMPPDDQKLFASYDAMKRSVVADTVHGLQPLAFEGTTFASSCLYTHNRTDREDRKAYFISDKEVAKNLSPNITRSFKTLDVGAKGEHAFYMSKVEIGLSLAHPLHTNETLRQFSLASAQYRFVQPEEGEPLRRSGATPKDLATGTFAVVPLWSVGGEMGRVMDAAQAEATANTMPMRGVAMRLSSHETETYDASMKALHELDAFLRAPGKPEPGETHASEHLLSFATLFSNQNAIEAFTNMVMASPAVSGQVDGLTTTIDGLATATRDAATEATEARDEEVGRLVMIRLRMPRGN